MISERRKAEPYACCVRIAVSLEKGLVRLRLPLRETLRCLGLARGKVTATMVNIERGDQAKKEGTHRTASALAD